MRERVAAARQIQQERFKGEECRFNSQMGKRQIENCRGLKSRMNVFLNDVFRHTDRAPEDARY